MGGESYALRRHAGNGVHPDFDARGEAVFDAAVDECFGGDLAVTLKAYFRWANRAMTAYPRSMDDVPDGLAVPRWDWDAPWSESPPAG